MKVEKLCAKSVYDPPAYVKVNTYLTDIRYRADLPAIREAIFGKKLPASTLVAVSALAHPDWLIEVEAIAVV